MRLQIPGLMALLMLGAFPETSASQTRGPARALVRPAVQSLWAPDRKNPYGKLFTPNGPLTTQSAPTPSAPGVAGKPELKCGMTMVPADPSIDPLIAISRPPDGTRFTIRAIPPHCR